MRKICVVTGSRAEYGLLKPIITSIKDHPKLKIQLLVAGMHLSKKFGYTKKEIERDGFKIDGEVPMHPYRDAGHYMAEAIGDGVKGMTRELVILNPDVVVILGDRIEALAAAIAAAYMNIPIAHIHGGDKSKAGLDESVRHAITKLAYVHLAATSKSAERILKMGEDKWRVFVVGAPGIDLLKNQSLYPKNTITQKYDLEGDLYLILLQHPVTTQSEQAGQQIIETLVAIDETKIQTIVIYPNSDAGGRDIINQIEKYLNNINFKIFPNIPRKDFLSLMKYASAIVGNSSCGIIEAPYFGISVVNIGIRQDGRERANNIIDVQHDRYKIKKAIRKAVSIGKQLNIQSPYGKGNAGKKIANILAKISIRQDLIQKTITY